MRVKIIDEYNRIPTRTQSALLTLMADNYAEMLDHVYECPEAAWYLTANDDAGGGTYQVIEALRDRIDIVVKALHFNPRFLGDLLARIEEDVQPGGRRCRARSSSPRPRSTAPHGEILAVRLPAALRRRLEFFASQFEFFERRRRPVRVHDQGHAEALRRRLPGRRSRRRRGKDRVKDLGSQTRNGFSVRTLMTALVFVKAMAWFRGNREV